MQLANISYVPAILAGLLAGYYAYHRLFHYFVFANGALIGCFIALIVISIFAIDDDLVVYVLLLVGIVVGST